MGIPSYFKHILDRYPRLLKGAGTTAPVGADVLLVDFNCLIYGCIRSPKMPPYTEEGRVAWEDAALREIQSYVVHLWSVAGRPATVLLGVDGVVPMAKIKQQRARRFKSVWLAEQEAAAGVRAAGAATWDTNAITPGTEFMERLTVSLKALAAARGGEKTQWIVSGAEEPGEGEQKLMQWVRAAGPEQLRGKHICVYGLDADLIVLCLTHAAGAAAPDATWSILREKQEFGAKAAAAAGTTQEFCLLSVSGLLQEFVPRDSLGASDYMSDYMCGMSLLGNDFLPHSLGISIREGGHDRLRAALASLHASGGRLVLDGCVCRNGLLAILRDFAATEEEDICTAFLRKVTMRGPPPRSDAERAMLPVQNLPLEWAEEELLWTRATNTFRGDWRSALYQVNLRHPMPVTTDDIQQRCVYYVAGLQWVVDYYTGRRAVSREWMYPWALPPLWSDLLAYVESVEELPQPPDAAAEPVLKPQEQLALVLPLKSWGLVREPALRALPGKLPYAWPTTFSFRSLGKRWMWECEPHIPILTPARLRAVLRGLL